MAVYRPRMHCILTVPSVVGEATTETLSFPIRARSATVVLNDHNHADTLSVEAEWGDVGVDPRLIKNGIVQLWMGNANDRGAFTPSNANLRFLGVVHAVERKFSNGGGQVLALTAHDYTAFFLEQK